MTAVRVQDHPSFGRAAFAQRAYRQGEVIIREPPLLITEPDNKLTIKCLQLVSGHGTSDELEDGSRVDPSFLGGSIEQFMAWCMATPEVQKKVLDDMYNTPNLEQMATSFVISSTKWAAHILSKHIVPHLSSLLPSSDTLPQCCDTGTVWRILLSWSLNCHGVNERSGGCRGLPRTAAVLT